MAEANVAETNGPSFRLIYRSHSLIPSSQRDTGLAAIFQEARTKNSDAGITGALLITDHWFVQALEGQESAVRALFERIGTDSRHDQVSLVSADPVEERVFARWAMARISDSGGGDVSLQADDGVLQPGAGEPATRGRDAVLRTMRSTIGADTV